MDYGAFGWIGMILLLALLVMSTVLLVPLGVQTVHLTGDHARTADAVARQLRIDTVIADALPEQKAEKVKDLQA